VGEGSGSEGRLADDDDASADTVLDIDVEGMSTRGRGWASGEVKRSGLLLTLLLALCAISYPTGTRVPGLTVGILWRGEGSETVHQKHTKPQRVAPTRRHLSSSNDE
jgi:hypothetical protein